MAKHTCNYLSSCCDSEVIYGTNIDFDDRGAFGICSNCHDYESFHDEGHTPWDDDSNFSYVAKHDCELISVCCSERPFGEVDLYLTGFCSKCHEGTSFECELDENCKNTTDVLLGQVYNRNQKESKRV